MTTTVAEDGECMNPFYRHYKGRFYQVVGEALDTRDDGPVIVYRTLYVSGYELFTRPRDEFLGMVSTPQGIEVRRFQPVTYDELPDEARGMVLRQIVLATDG